MSQSKYCTPQTFAEKQNLMQCNRLESFLTATTPASYPYQFRNACDFTTIDNFQTELTGDFQLDPPLALAIAAKYAPTHPEQSTFILANSIPLEKMPTSDEWSDAVFQSLFSPENFSGNYFGVREAQLRATWKAQASNGFKLLKSGEKLGTIRLSPHITIEPRKIGKGGDLRRGASMIVRIRGLPMTAVHSLPSPVVTKAGGTSGKIRVGARDLQRIEQASNLIADARIKSHAALRFSSSKIGGGILAFGPSAISDFLSNSRIENNSVSTNWKQFAIDSSKSQSGNLAGFLAGAAAAKGAAALGIVAAVGWPVVVVGLGVGLVAQIAWSASGSDDWVKNEMTKKIGQ